MSISTSFTPENLVKAMEAHVNSDLQHLIYKEVEGMARPIIEKIAKDIAQSVRARMSAHIDYRDAFDNPKVVIAFNGEILNEGK